MLWTTAVTDPFKLVIAIDFHIANHHANIFLWTSIPAIL